MFVNLRDITHYHPSIKTKTGVKLLTHTVIENAEPTKSADDAKLPKRIDIYV